MSALGANEKVLRIDLPLSVDTQVSLTFSGMTPQQRDFMFLAEYLKVFAKSLSPMPLAELVPANIPELPSPPVLEMPTPLVVAPKRQNNKPRKPCEKHPNSEWNEKSHRCMECMRDHGRSMIKRRLELRAQREGQTTENNDTPPDTPEPPALVEEAQEVEKPKLKYLYSVPITCPLCQARQIRLRRSATADMDQDFWVHERAGVKPCLVKIAYYKIADDPTWKPQ